MSFESLLTDFDAQGGRLVHLHNGRALEAWGDRSHLGMTAAVRVGRKEMACDLILSRERFPWSENDRASLAESATDLWSRRTARPADPEVWAARLKAALHPLEARYLAFGEGGKVVGCSNDRERHRPLAQFIVDRLSGEVVFGSSGRRFALWQPDRFPATVYRLAHFTWLEQHGHEQTVYFVLGNPVSWGEGAFQQHDLLMERFQQAFPVLTAYQELHSATWRMVELLGDSLEGFEPFLDLLTSGRHPVIPTGWDSGLSKVLAEQMEVLARLGQLAGLEADAALKFGP